MPMRTAVSEGGTEFTKSRSVGTSEWTVTSEAWLKAVDAGRGWGTDADFLCWEVVDIYTVQYPSWQEVKWVYTGKTDVSALEVLYIAPVNASEALTRRGITSLTLRNVQFSFVTATCRHVFIPLLRSKT